MLDKSICHFLFLSIQWAILALLYQWSGAVGI